MGQGVAKQKSKHGWLRAAVAAVVVPGFGVPITKWVESYYDVSFFSPMIATLWNVVKSCWAWIGRDVTISFWALSLLSVGSLLLLLLGTIFVYSNYFEAKQKPWKTLTGDQQLAFTVVGEAIQNSRQIGFPEVQKISGLSVIATRSALDVLIHYDFIRIVRDSWGNPYFDLTFSGQQQFLELSSGE